MMQEHDDAEHDGGSNENTFLGLIPNCSDWGIDVAAHHEGPSSCC